MEAPSVALEIKGAITAVIAFGTALFGWIGWLVVVWVVCMVLDYLSGTFAAIKRGAWKSSIARQGLWHKLGGILAVCVAALCDIAINVVVGQFGGAFEYHGYITPIVVLWYIFTELGSIIENAAMLSDNVPPFLKRLIDKFKKTAEDTGDNIANTDNKKDE